MPNHVTNDTTGFVDENVNIILALFKQRCFKKSYYVNSS